MRPPQAVRLGLVVAAAILGALTSPLAAAEPPAEYKIKAAYVSKLVRFVEWPETHPIQDEMLVGVAGDDEFQQAMRDVDGRSFAKTRIRVRSVNDPGALDGIHVLVIGPLRSETRAASYVRAARDRPILTIGDAGSFTREGGIIQFVIVQDSVRFAINVDAAERVGLTVSSRLLRLATNLRTAPD